MTDYRLIALDIDGTLARNDRSLSQVTIDTLVEAQQRGLRVVIASGRPTYGIAHVAEALQLEKFGGFVLAFNGGEIWNWQNQERIYAQALPDEVIPVLYRCTRDAGFDMMTYQGAYIVTEAAHSSYIQLSAARNRMQVKVVADFLAAVDKPLSKCMIVGDADRLQPFETVLTAALQGRANAYRSEPFCLEVVPKGIDKAKCLGILLEKLELDRSGLIACGDGFNDISMIQFAGLGVAMGNAQDCVKKAADYITLSNEADGVANVVRKFFLDVEP
ncbi:MAG: HAD family phosphatase [Bacteroidaceae bacterium]|nr:HAD family phosphatase [Bacteroidaceae bacterium]